MADPDTPEQWRAYALRQEGSATHLMHGGFRTDAVFHAGLAVEAMLKGAIMERERLNAWPPRSSRPDLYVHSLQALAKLAGIDVFGLVNDPIAPMWQTVLLWRRAQAYDPWETPEQVATDMVLAACGAEGVNRWIEHRFQLGR